MTNFRESSMLWDHELWFCARSNSLLSPCPKSDQRLLKGACAATAATGWPQNVSLPKNALHPPLEWGAASDDLVKKQWKQWILALLPCKKHFKELTQPTSSFWLLLSRRICCTLWRMGCRRSRLTVESMAGQSALIFARLPRTLRVIGRRMFQKRLGQTL